MLHPLLAPPQARPQRRGLRRHGRQPRQGAQEGLPQAVRRRPLRPQAAQAARLIPGMKEVNLEGISNTQTLVMVDMGQAIREDTKIKLENLSSSRS